MVDFKKRLGMTSVQKKTNPAEIYESLDRKSEVGPLRPSQLFVLNEWYEKRKDKKNNIIKLHTCEGKTLIGLLILNSKLNSKEGPCIYVCPNIYLFEQTCIEAERFGIPFCKFEDRNLPESFLNSEKILITYVQKVFHGFSKLGIDSSSLQIGSIILDDSHACIDSIKDSFCIKTKNDHLIYKELIALFEEDLKSQGEGTFIDIQSGEYSTFLPISYWSWFDKQDQVVSCIAKHRESSDEVKYAWSLIKDSIDKCQAFISGKNLEIVPYFIPIHKYGFFHNAKNRILMSATTQDDSFFILGLDFDVESVQNPITNSALKWSGEKMIIIPSLINEELDRNLIIQKLVTKNDKRSFGTAAITPSYKQTDDYEKFGCKVVTRDNINEIIRDLKNKKFEEAIVFANRYDGIDLPDEACRILIIDSKPFFNSLSDKYEESSRPDSDITNIKIAQKIEQGLGRSVRGEKDYSAIILIGSDLVKFVKSSSTNKYFSAQTQQQIEIGKKIVEFAKEDSPVSEVSDFTIVIELLGQVIKRDEGWKEFYKEEMEKIDQNNTESSIMIDLRDEREAEKSFFFGNYQQSCEKVQRIADKFNSKPQERGWYLQMLARMKYNLSKTESNDIQKNAFSSNHFLLKPKSGISYQKITIIEDNRIRNIRNWINNLKSNEELLLTIDNILNDFSFSVEADKFEQAVKEIGVMLGFVSQRPDKEYKKVPDNLWCGVRNEYIFYECKSEVSLDRPEISKTEAGQMNSHCGWFEEEYGDTVRVNRILIHPTRKLSYYGNFTHEVKVMRRNKLNELKKNIQSFFKEFLKHNIGDITDSTMSSYLVTHKLDFNSLFNNYCEDVVPTPKA